MVHLSVLHSYLRILEPFLPLARAVRQVSARWTPGREAEIRWA